MKKALIVLALILSTTPTFAECEDCFYGAWNLISITAPDGTVTTFEDLGVYHQIQFLPDHTFIRMENIEVVSQGEWYIGFAIVHCLFGQFCLQMLGASTGDMWNDPIVIENNILELKIGCPESAIVEKYS